MTQVGTSVIVGAALGALVATVYLTVGALVVRRAARERQAALVGFSTFWLGVGLYAAIDSAWAFSLLAGAASLMVSTAVLHLKVAAVCAGFGGLVAYLVRLYSGRVRLVAAVGAYYASVFLALEWHYFMRVPIGQKLGTWGAQVVYANPSPQPAWALMLAALMLPPMLAAIAYASLLRVAREPAIRRRIVLTSSSLLLVLAPTLLSWLAGGWPWFGLVGKLLSLAAALAMMGAVTQARRHGRPMEEGLTRQLDALRDSKRAALMERARELV